MMGVFVQLNTASRRFGSQPIGYLLQENGCWEWVGTTRSGYGRLWLDGRMQEAHRVLYESHRGPIPTDLQLDHLCRNRACVNPDHLEAVPPRVNTLRGYGACAGNARKTHCPQGHPLAGSNLTTWDWTSRGERRCRECRKARQGKYDHARRAGARP